MIFSYQHYKFKISFTSKQPFKVYRFVFFSLLLLFVIRGQTAFAQMIDNSKGQAFTDAPFFNEEKIKAHRIHTIVGTYLNYKLGDKLRQSRNVVKYLFSKNGRLIEKREIQLLNPSSLIVTKFEYNKKGNLICKQHIDFKGTYAYYYKYNESNQIIFEELRRNYRNNEYDRIFTKLNDETIVYTINSTYSLIGNQVKQTIYNNEGTAYKVVMHYYNSNHQLTSVESHLNRTSRRKNTHYYYNNSGNIDSICVRSNTSSVMNRTFVYEYNDINQLVKKKEFKKGEMINQYEVLYDEDSGLINDIFFQNAATNFIRDLVLWKYTRHQLEN